MMEQLRLELRQAAEPKLREFNRRIISDTRYPILGVRTPTVRALAKKAAGDWRSLLEAEPECYEEVQAVGLALAYAREPFSEKTEGLRRLLPRLDSWGLTDTIVPTLKPRAGELEQVWQFAMECLDSQLEYTVRFGIVLMLDYFLTEDYMPRVAQAITAIRDPRYYVNMARAWLLAEMATKDLDRVLRLLESGTLDLFTHNMTIRKLRESLRFTRELKDGLLPLKRKEEQ